MKIVFVTDTLSSGGSERVLSTLANSLCKTYEVSIVCLRKRMIAYDINPAIKLAFADDHHRTSRLNYCGYANIYGNMTLLSPSCYLCL